MLVPAILLPSAPDPCPVSAFFFLVVRVCIDCHPCQQLADWDDVVQPGFVTTAKNSSLSRNPFSFCPRDTLLFSHRQSAIASRSLHPLL